jgi:voltage-gated potassium channel
MSLPVSTGVRQARGPRASGPGMVPEGAAISLPGRRRTPLTAVALRAGLAVGLLLLSTVIVYLGRYGYRDNARPGQPLNLLGALYYSAVTLSTTGYGDIVPVTSGARLINTLVLTPVRVVFLILLIGTTLEVLAERTRTVWRVNRWRSKMAGHTVLVGYGTKGRSAMTTLREAGVPATSIVVVDCEPRATMQVNAAGLAGVTGDATRREVLASAEIATAARLIIAVGRDDTAVLITLTARQLCTELAITAAVRESENEPLLMQSGADHVVVSSDAAGRLLGLATVDPGAGRVMSELLGRGRELDLRERPAAALELGRPAREAAPGIIALLRDGSVVALDDPRAASVQDGDRLVLVAGASNGRPGLPVGVLRRREGAGDHLTGECLGGVPQCPGHVGVALDELGRPRRQPGHVLPDQDLGVAVRPGADPDGRDVEAGGHPPGQVRRHAFEHDRECPGGLESLGVAQQPLAVLAPALDLVAAERVHRLRSKAEMRHDRNAGRDQFLDLPDDAVAALELDRLGAGLLQEPDAGLQRRGRGCLI